MSKNKSFFEDKRVELEKRPSEERIKDFKEIEKRPEEGFIKTQSKRCMDCGVPFCQSKYGCPLSNLIPEWNKLASEGKWAEALERLHATNNFPEFTGVLCPAPCESACVAGLNIDAVNIRSIELGIIEQGFKEGFVKPQIATVKTGKKICIIGSGPAGLAAAQQLVRMGHEVTVIEKGEKPGGILRYGIPDFKLEKHVIDRRVEQMNQEGVKFLCGKEFGKDIKFEDLEKEFDVIALATGASQPRDLKIPGRDLKGVHFAMDFLIKQNRVLSGEMSELISMKDKNVVVIGGGDTGADCVATSIRQGAKSILQFEIQPKPPLLRSEKTPWPLWPLKLKSSYALEEGGLREFSIMTEEFLGANQITGLKAKRVLNSNPQQAEELVFKADAVILAMGFTGCNQETLSSIPGLGFSERGNIETKGYQTNNNKVFACGDARRGQSLIVWAILEGREMAKAINQHLKITT